MYFMVRVTLKPSNPNTAATRIITPGKNISFPADKSSKKLFAKVPIATIQQQLMATHSTTFFM
jgi:hypothetical protein